MMLKGLFHLKLFRLSAAVISALVLGVTLLTAVPASAADSISYTFRFVNGQTLSGVANDKTFFLADAGGPSADNPTGMEVHLSCSDKFPGGWGEKDGPVQGVDTAWQISSYFIQKGNKTCGTPTPPPPPPDPPAIDIEKFVNGLDADDPTGPEIQIGETATFTYEVTNTGGIALRNVEVVDSELGAIGCPRSELDVGESMSCDEQTEVVTTDGQFTMKATVTAIGDVQTPGLPPGSPSKGDAYRFTFVNGTTIVNVGKKNDFFANAGGTSVDNPTGMKVHLSCSDEFPGGWGEKDGPVQGVDTAWQIESFSIGKVKEGRFELKCGDPFVTTSEQEVMDMDPVYFIVPPPPPPADPEIDIEKYVNGDDADNPPGPTLETGTDAEFTYVVTNTGDVALERIVAIDNVVGTLNCPRTELGVGESMECSPTTMVVEDGQNFMEACVTGFNGDREVDDCDPVYYRGEKDEPSAWIGDMVSYEHSGGGASDVKVDLFLTGADGSRSRFLGDTRTDADGNYAFHPEPGCYTLVFIAPYGWEFVGGNKYRELMTCVNSGETDNSLDAVLRKL